MLYYLSPFLFLVCKTLQVHPLKFHQSTSLLKLLRIITLRLFAPVYLIHVQWFSAFIHSLEIHAQ